MKFYLPEVDADLNLKEFLSVAGICALLYGGLALFKLLLMMI